MHGIQGSSEQVSAGSNQLAVSAQDIAEGATSQAAAVEELVATVEEVTNQVLENTKSTDIVHDKAKQVGIEAANSQQKMDELVDAMKKNRYHDPEYREDHRRYREYCIPDQSAVFECFH